MNVSSQPIRSECLRTASKCYIFYESLHPNIIGCLRITSKHFLTFSARFLAANEKRVSQNFIKVISKFSACFLAAKQKRVSQNFIKVIFNFSARSSQPIRSECLRTASKCYIFYKSLHPNIIGCLRITSKHFLNFSARFLAANEKRVSQNFIKVISKFSARSWQPIKSECLRISSKYFFKFSGDFLAANEK